VTYATYKDDVSYFKVLSHRRSLGCILVRTIATTMIGVIDPVLSPRLVEMGMKEENCGLAFGTHALSFAISVVVVSSFGGGV